MAPAASPRGANLKKGDEMEVQKSAITVYIRYQVVVDEKGHPRDGSGTFVKELIFEKPNSTLISVDAAFHTNGTDRICSMLQAPVI